MRAVKSKDTKPELVVRKIVHSLGYRYRLHRNDLPGQPDIVLPAKGKVIFVNGCFWHGHACKRGARQPKNNADYWKTKIARNVVRDKQNLEALTNSGWQCLTVWECEISVKKRPALVSYLAAFLEIKGDPKLKRHARSKPST